MRKLVIIIPTLNEAEGIEHTLCEVFNSTKNVNAEISVLVIDGGSTDGTPEIAQRLGAKVITQRGRGKGRAIIQALKLIKSLPVDFIAILDGDFSYPAGYIPKMISILERDKHIGMVTGKRIYDNSASSFIYRVGNIFLRFVHKLLDNVDLEDPLTGFRVIRGVLARKLSNILSSPSFDIEVEINYFVQKMGYHIFELPIRYRARKGRKKLGVRHGVTILLRILRLKIDELRGRVS